MVILAETIYRLTVKGNMKMVTTQDSFATVGEYKLTQLDSGNLPADCREYVLEEQKVALTEYFNPVTMQIMEYVNRLARIYDRQHIVVEKREIRELRNIEEIRQKWEVLKKELMLINPVSAFEVVRGKDREMRDLGMIKENLANTHFMHVFLYMHGYNLTTTEKYRTYREERDRMGIGFHLPVTIDFSATTTNGMQEIQAKAVIDENKKIDKRYISKVTEQHDLTLSHLTKGTYKKDAAGHLREATVDVYEQISNDYKTDLYITLETLKHQTYGG